MPGGDKGGSKKARARNEELDRRLDEVESLIVRACTGAEIAKVMADKYRISKRQSEEYVSKVYARWRAEASIERPLRRERQVRRLLRTVRLAHDAKAYSAAVSAEALIGKIEGTEFAGEKDDSLDDAEFLVNGDDDERPEGLPEPDRS